jgi:hypothetical protein
MTCAAPRNRQKVRVRRRVELEHSDLRGRHDLDGSGAVGKRFAKSRACGRAKVIGCVDVDGWLGDVVVTCTALAWPPRRSSAS